MWPSGSFLIEGTQGCCHSPGALLTVRPPESSDPGSVYHLVTKATPCMSSLGSIPSLGGLGPSPNTESASALILDF